MGKTKAMLEEDMMLHPELYDKGNRNNNELH